MSARGREKMHDAEYKKAKLTCICGCKPVAVLRLDSTVRLPWCKSSCCAARFGVIVEDKNPGASDAEMREFIMEKRYSNRPKHYKTRNDEV